MSPFIDKMRRNIADALDIDISQVNVKATTEEKLGFTGSGEGISSQAVCLLTSPVDSYTRNVTFQAAAPAGGEGGCCCAAGKEK